MLTLRAPSFHVGAGRAFTRSVPTSDAPCRPSAPAVGSFFRPPASAPCASLEHAKSVSPRDQNRSTVPSLRGAISSSEKMEERLEAPSIVSTPLPAFADPRGLSAVHTRRLAAPDRAIRHAFPVTFKLDACAPFRSGAGVTQHLCGENLAPCGARLRRPSRLLRFREERLPSAFSGSSSLRRAGPPSCAPSCDGTRSTSPMRSTDFCFPLFRLRALAPRSFPASLRDLRLAPSPEGLRPG